MAQWPVALRLSPVLAILLAGLVYSLLPRGVFGVHDAVARAALCGGAAALASFVLIVLNKRSRRFSC